MHRLLARGLLLIIILVLAYGFYVLGWGVKTIIPEEGASWIPRNSCLQERTEVTATTYQGQILVVGGFDKLGQTTATTQVYDPATDTCSTIADLPRPVHHAMSVTLDGIPYVIGGFSGIAFAPTDKVYHYNNGWVEVAPLPQKLGAGAAVVWNSLLYVVSGQGEAGDVGAHYVYDPANNTWESLLPIPQARDHLAAAVLDNKLYVIGGRENGNFAKNVSRVDIYDLLTDTWSSGPSLVKARSGHGAVSTGTSILVAGGEEPVGTIAPVESLDSTNSFWRVVTRLPTPRHGLGVVIVDRTVYVLSGGKRPGLSVSATIEAMKL